MTSNDDLKLALDGLKAEIAELRKRVEFVESRPISEPYYRPPTYQPQVWATSSPRTDTVAVLVQEMDRELYEALASSASPTD